MKKEPDSYKILDSGRILLAASKCGCQQCNEMLDLVAPEYILVSVRFAKLANENPGLMFKILIEEWDRNDILRRLPELYSI